MKTPRYQVDQNDSNTFQVVDMKDNCEVCVVGNFQGHEDAEERAEMIAAALNKAEEQI